MEEKEDFWYKKAEKIMMRTDKYQLERWIAITGIEKIPFVSRSARFVIYLLSSPPGTSFDQKYPLLRHKKKKENRTKQGLNLVWYSCAVGKHQRQRSPRFVPTIVSCKMMIGVDKTIHQEVNKVTFYFLWFLFVILPDWLSHVLREALTTSSRKIESILLKSIPEIFKCVANI